MHELVPRPLLEAVASGTESATAVGPVLSIDLVGFTSMAWTLAANGDRGAEALAEIADRVFAPIVTAVHGHGGYVGEFGGDAILGLFPGDAADRTPHALAAALEIAAEANARGPVHTRFGDFLVGVKVALAHGETRWDVLDDAKGTRSAYVFWGAAVERAATLAAGADPGDVVVDDATAAVLGPLVSTQAWAGRRTVTGVEGALPPPTPAVAPERLHPLAARFAPDRLLTWSHSGELRPVVSVFLTLPADAGIDDVRVVVSHVFRLRDTYGGHVHQVERAEKGWVVLLYWGAPQSFPGDVERALSLLMALKAECPVTFKAGATVGTAFSGFVGAPVQQGFSCYGSHVNLAARMMAAAEPGALLVDGSMLRQAAGIARTRSLGLHGFKGVGERVEVFELVRPKSAPVRLVHAVVGRELELADLDRVIDDVVAGGRSRTCLVTGEQGSGKTTLLDEARRRREGVAGLRWMVCRSESHGARSLHPVRDLLRRWSGAAAGQDVATTARRFDARVARLAAGAEEPLRAELLERASFLAALLDLPAPGSAWAATPAEDRFDGMVAAVSAFLRAQAGNGPVVLQLEDVQWLDPASRELLGRIVDDLGSLPLAVVATRPDADDAALLGRAADEHLELRPLGTDDLGRLAAALLPGEPPGWLAGWLAEWTDGNTLFAEQLVSFLAGQGYFDGPSAAVPPPDVEVPPDLRSVLVARMDRLSAQARLAVEAGAVLGPWFEPPILARTLEVAGVAPDEVAAAEQQVVAAGLWVTENDLFGFTNELVRAAALDVLLTSTLRELHAGAALVLEEQPDLESGRLVARLARHHRGAGHPLQAAGYECRASEQALLLGAYREAGERAEHGLADLADAGSQDEAGSLVDQELALVLALGSSRMITHGQSAPETVQAYGRAQEITEALPPSRQSFQALFGLRMAAAFKGDLLVAAALGERSLAMAREMGADDLQLEAMLMVGNAQFWRGEVPAAIASLEVVRSAPTTSSHGEFVQQRRLTALFPLLLSRWVSTGGADVLAAAEAGVVEARELGHRLSEAIVVETAAFLAILAGEVELADRYGHDLLDLAEAESYAVYEAMARAVVGWVRAARGEPGDPVADVGRAIHDLSARRVLLGQSLLRCFHADAALRAGRPDLALEATSAGLRHAARTGEQVMVPELRRLMALAEGHLERPAADDHHTRSAGRDPAPEGTR